MQLFSVTFDIQDDLSSDVNPISLATLSRAYVIKKKGGGGRGKELSFAFVISD